MLREISAVSELGSLERHSLQSGAAHPVSEEVAEEFQAALREMARGGGMTATVMSPEGTWSGAPSTP